MPEANPTEGLRIGVRGLQELPPLPQTAQRLLAAVNDEDIDIATLARLIETSPSISARVVGLARSAYFGARGPVRSVSEAIVRVLGLTLVKNLVIGIGLSRPFDPSRCPLFSAEQYWGSALLTASLGRLLATEAEVEADIGQDDVYLCGLLHNLGLLALAHVVPDGMGRVLEAAAKSPERRLTEIETEQLGAHHCQAGAWLAARWKLPPEVITVMGHHHDLHYRGPNCRLNLLVGLATTWASQHLAGVEEPWVEPTALKALGIGDPELEEAARTCRKNVSEIIDLSRQFADSH